MEEKVASVAASALMSLPCGNHISTANPSSSILRTRSSNGRSRKTISAQTASGNAGSGDGARFSGLLIISRPPQDAPAALHGLDGGQRDLKSTSGVLTGAIRARPVVDTLD